MKRAMALLAVCAAFVCAAAAMPPAGGGSLKDSPKDSLKDSLKYVSPGDISIEDVFFSRFFETIYNVDSTMHSQQVEAAADIDTARWNRELAAMTLWGETSEPATDTYNAAVRMFLGSPQSDYADAAERALYNGVLAALDTSRCHGEEWRRAAQAVLDAPATAYASRGCDLWVNLYFRNRAYVKNDSLDMVILQNTSAPWAGNVFVSVKFNRPATRMRLHLRLPAWLRSRVTPSSRYSFSKAREFYQVVLNGRNLALRASADGYITIDRVWQDDDVVRITMQTNVRRITDSAASGDSAGKFAVQEGPVVYALETRGERKFFDPQAAFGNNYDKEVLHANTLVTKGYSSPDTTADTPWSAVLVPYYIAFGRNAESSQLWLEKVSK